MAQRGYAALLVTGGAAHNPPMYYLANGAKVTERSVLVKQPGEEPMLFVVAMEREEARRSGLRVMDHGLGAANRAVQGRRRQPAASQRALAGRAAARGGRGAAAPWPPMARPTLGAAYELMTALSELHPELNFVGEFGNTVLRRPWSPRAPDEVKRIRRGGQEDHAGGGRHGGVS